MARPLNLFLKNLDIDLFAQNFGGEQGRMKPLQSKVFFSLANITVAPDKVNQPLRIGNGAGERYSDIWTGREDLCEGTEKIRANHEQYEQSGVRTNSLGPAFLKVDDVG